MTSKISFYLIGNKGTLKEGEMPSMDVSKNQIWRYQRLNDTKNDYRIDNNIWILVGRGKLCIWF